MTRILHERPPLWDAIVEVFPRAKAPGVFFSWGSSAIYYPSPMAPISYELVAHEAVHGERQDKLGVVAWWQKYLVDERFRFDEELLAHVAEYRAVCLSGASPSMRRTALHFISKRLASPLYGGMVTLEHAKRLIGA